MLLDITGYKCVSAAKDLESMYNLITLWLKTELKKREIQKRS